MALSSYGKKLREAKLAEEQRESERQQEIKKERVLDYYAQANANAEVARENSIKGIANPNPYKQHPTEVSRNAASAVNAERQKAVDYLNGLTTYEKKNIAPYENKAPEQEIQQAQVLSDYFSKEREKIAKEMADIRGRLYAKGGSGITDEEKDRYDALDKRYSYVSKELENYNKVLGISIGQRVQNALTGIVGTAVSAPAVIAQTAKTAWDDAFERLRDEELQKRLTEQRIRESQLGMEANFGYANHGDAMRDTDYLERLAELEQFKRTNEVMNPHTAVDMNTEAMQNIANAMTYTQQATKGLEGEKKVLADAAISVAENMMYYPTAVINPALPLALMGARASASRMYELGNRGMGAGEILARGLASGVIEAATEKMSLENVFDLVLKGGKGFVKNMLKQAGVEATEEGISYFMNYVFDNAYKDPTAKFDWREFRESVIAGGLSGAFFGLGGSMSNSVYNVLREGKANEIGNMYQQNDVVDDIIASALESAEDTEAYKLATELQSRREAGHEIADREIGNLVFETEKAIEAEEKATREADFTEALKNYGDSGAKAFGKFYDHKSNVHRFNAGFSRYYDSGLSNVPFEKIETMYENTISPEVRLAAYNAGVNDARASLTKEIENKKVFTDNRGLIENEFSADVPASTKSMLDRMGKNLGVPIKFVDKIVAGYDKDGNEITANGMYVDGMITIAKDSADPYMTVARHEITHHFQQAAPKEYRAFRDYAVQVMMGVNENIVNQYKRKYALEKDSVASEYAMDEIAAEFTEQILTDENKLNDFISETSGTKEGRTMLQRFFDSVKAFIKKVKSVFKGNKAKMDEAAKNEFGVTLEALERATALWGEAYDATKKAVDEAKAKGVEEGVASETTQGNAIYSLDMSFEKQVDAALNNSLGRYTSVYVMETPKILRELGLNNYPMLITQKHLRDINSTKSTKDSHRHGLSVSTIKKLPQLIEKPIMILSSSTNAGELVIVTSEVDSDKNPIVVIVKPNGKGQYNGVTLDSNFIKSMYGKDGINSFVQDGVKNNRVLYLDNKKTVNWAVNAKLQLLGSQYQNGFYTQNVAQFKNLVNKNNSTKFSLKDSTGRQLSAEQAEYFKDSKVRDADGNLMVVYHGSKNADFTVFNRSLNYYTNNKDMASSYLVSGELYEGYLNMTKPFVVDAKNEKWSGLAIDNELRDLLKYYGGSVFKERGKWRTSVADITSTIREAVDEGELDYDGVIVLNVDDTGMYYGKKDKHIGNDYITFNSNQFKNADNKKPTSNPDIRYSLPNGETVYAPAMYSQLERTVEQYKGDKISANGLIPYLKGKGVKDEEIKWSGIATYIEGKKSVAKDDLLGFLRANELYIDEQILAGTEEKFVTADGERILNSKEDFKDYVEMYVEDGMFMDYLPYDVTYKFGKDRWEAIGHYEDDDGDKWTDIIMQADPEETPETKWSDYILEDDGYLGNYRELLFVLPDTPYSNNAMNIHWGRSGVLAHARVQDVIDPDTDEVALFVEEIQSDWHNEGKKKGYEGVDKNKLEVLIDKAADLAVELKEMISGELSSLIDKALPFYSNERDFAIANLRTNKYFLETLEGRNIDITAKERDAYREFVDKQHELRRTDNELRRTADYGDYALVPDAPFKDSYVNYVLKRLIRDCAERGVSKLAWTTSEIQVDRWSEDFREGYRIEYDQEIPKFLKKYGKQWGASLGQMEVAGYTVPYIEINDKMRESVLYEGQPRFSLKGTSDILRENAKLKEQNDYLKGQMRLTKGFVASNKTVSAIATKLLNDYDSTLKATDIKEALKTLYNGIGNEMSWNDIKLQAMDIARDIVSSAVTINDEQYEAYSELKKFLRNTAITIAEEDRKSLTDGYNNFRKANFGKLKLTNDGTKVDMVYQTLSDMFPEYFDVETVTKPAEQLEDIVRVLDELNAYEENPYSSDTEGAAEWVANDIIDRYFDVEQAKPSYADKQKAKLDKQKYKDAEKLKAVRDEKNAKIDSIKADATRRVEKLRKQKNAKIDGMKKRQKAKEAKMSERRKASILRSKILRHIAPMKKKLLTPTDNQHITKELRTTVAAVLEAINTESKFSINAETGKVMRNDSGLPTKRTEAFMKLKEELERIRKEEGDLIVLDPSLLGVETDGISSKMVKLIGELSNIRIDDMNSEQLTVVWEVLRAVEHSISTANKVFASKRFASVVDMAYAFSEDSAKMKPLRSKTREHFAIDLQNPYTYFSHYGQAGLDFYRMLRDAQDKEQILQDELAERVRKIVSLETRQKLEKELVEFETEGKDTLTLSKAHIMELYLLYQRPHARQHLLYGGIHQPEINNKIRRSSEVTMMTAEDFASLFDKLTDAEKKLADDLQKLTLFLAEKGNEASMQVFGYEKFNDPNYWTIKVSSEGIYQDTGKTQDTARSVKNMGSAKALEEEAKNPLDVNGIFKTFDAHASDMICYSAWLAPMEDANRLYNFKFRNSEGKPTGRNFVSLLRTYGGERAEGYWKNLMKDIQNGIGGEMDESFSKVVNKTIGNVKKASIAGNIRVVAQQPTAWFRAGVVLNADNMAKGITGGVTKGNGWKKAVKYAPIAARKKTGGFEISASPAQLGEVLYSAETRKGKAIQLAKDLPLASAAKADEITWGAIWNACEYQVRDTNKSVVVGSESFYEAVAELFTDVIDQTQVVDGVLQRSQIMRSSNALNKQATAFMGEPTLALNLVMRSYDKVRRSEGKARSEAKRQMGRAVFSLMLSNIAVAFMQSVVDALRDDDDEKEYFERLKTAFLGITGDEKSAFAMAYNFVLAGNLGSSSNPVAWIPYVKDTLSILEGYTVERLDASAISDFITASTNTIKSLSGEGKWTTGYATLKMLAAGGKLFGSSASNVMRDVESIYRTIASSNTEMEYGLQKKLYNMATQRGVFYNTLYKAIKDGDKELYAKIEKDLYDNGVKPSDIKSAMKSRYEKDADAGAEFLKNAKDIAGIRFSEESKTNNFTKSDLDNKQAVEFDNKTDDIMDDIESDFNANGFAKLSKEEQNKLLNDAIKYAEAMALEQASGGQSGNNVAWIEAASEGAFGLDVGEYIMLKNEYSAQSLLSDNAYKAYDADIDIELYLAIRDALKEIDGEGAKDKKEAYLEKYDFTDEQMDVWADICNYKNWD